MCSKRSKERPQSHPSQPDNPSMTQFFKGRGSICIALVIFLASIATRQHVPTEENVCPSKPHRSRSSEKERESSSDSIYLSPYSSPDYTGPQTTWKPYAHPFPCEPVDVAWRNNKVQRSPADTGLLFVREMKTGSSTLAGVILRIAHLRGSQLLPHGGPCRMRIDHSSARELDYANRNRMKSVVISLLREPTKRVISQFFHFRVSQNKVDPTDAKFIQYLKGQAPQLSNYYTKDLTMRDIDLEEEDHEAIIQDILNEYNFIAITERMDESLVVLKLLLGLDYRDILYMSAKKHGSFTSSADNSCIYIVPSFITEGMQNFFKSRYWEKYLRADRLLYQAAVKSLDNTIDALGRDLVEQQVQIFRQALQYAQHECDAHTIYRCNSRGDFVGDNSTCYLWDIGCGHDCLDAIQIEQAIGDEMEDNTYSSS